VFFGTDIVGLSTGGSERVRVDASGNVGIGTSSPVGKLNVIGGAGIGAALTGDQAVTPPSGSLVLSGSNLSSEQTYTSPGGATTLGQIYNYASSGNSFFRYLDIVSYGSTTGAGSNIRFITGNGTTNVERARFDSSGRLLLSTTSAIVGSGARLHIVGNPCSRMQVTSNGSAAIVFHNASVDEVGLIQINSSSTSYVTSSDYRLKHDIQPMTGALAKVAQLKPVTYKWNADDSQSQGFIAHELQEVVPECVTGEKDAVNEDGSIKAQGIDTSFLVATLTAAIQEQQAIITALTARVEALEGAQA
jgi:hypothetical protein